VSRRDVELDLTRPAGNGVYFVGAEDLGRLEREAERHELHVGRTDLAGCHGKGDLLRRMAASLHLPASFGFNWDALADCLRDLGWLPGWGYVLLFEHVDELRQAASADYDILLGILDDAATFGNDRDMPWFAFLAMPDAAFDDEQKPVGRRPSPSHGKTMQTIEFELEGDYVELNMLLKLVGLCDSGGAGKAIVASGAVKVDGAIELRKTCKIHAGQVAVIDGTEIHVVADPNGHADGRPQAGRSH
jgi:ribosome-associated protein YbcJ (S4-like RNA binding protein)